MNKEGFSTRSIHEGEAPESMKHGDVISPINPTTTFANNNIRELEEGYEYSRTNNPTRNRLEIKLASLEEGKYGLAYSSGVAAEATLLFSLLSPGDRVLAFNNLYGGTKRLFSQVMERFEIKFDYVDATNPNEVKENIKTQTKLIWLESPTNPLMKIADINKISEIGSKNDVMTVVDNSFSSPYFQRPLELGSDLVVESLTKYISGHSDVVGGAIVTSKESIFKILKFHQNAVGAILSPFDSWLVMKGLKTLKPRMELHEKNALEVARFLESHPKVVEVHYPGLQSHPQYKLAKEQMKGFGGMLSFEIKGDAEAVSSFVENLELFALAESLGGIESLVGIPALMSHDSLTRRERDEAGIKDSLIRLSIGIEEVENLINDLESALEKID